MADVLSKLANIYGEFEGETENTPCSLVPDGPLMGNGDLGAVFSARDSKLELYISKNDFWYSVTGREGGGIKSLAFLQMRIADDPSDIHYSAKQRILHAEIEYEIAFKNSGGTDQLLSVRSYVLKQENTVITEVSCLKGDPRLRFDLVPVTDMHADYSHTVKGGTVTVTKSYTDENAQWHTCACAQSRIIGKDTNFFRLFEGESVRIVTAVATNHDTSDYEEHVKQSLSRDFDAILPCLWKEHADLWDGFWKLAWVDLHSLPEIERFWYASHYIMACCSGEGKFAPGIFGNFITHEFPEWGGDYHLNYNYEAPWWGVYSSNRISLAEPYDRPLLDCIPAMQKNARAFLNCSGLYSLVGIGPKGLEVTVSYYRDGTRSVGTGFWGQKSNASYAAVNMAMRFYSTYDKEYAKNCAYPYMREAALFWEDYLRFEDGRYVIHNDCVNENIYAGIGIYDWATPDARDTSNDFNPIISLALIRLIMKTLIDICEYVGINDDHLEKWAHILAHISQFPTQIREGERVFRLTESGEDWNYENSLIVQHIYPCGAIGLSSDPELLELSRRTVRQADRWGTDYNAFPTFYTAAARVGYDADTILSNLEKQLREHSYKNFFVFYGGGGIECCSTVPNCINEMLFQSHEGILRFFPVWKRELDARFENLRGYGAFLATAEQSDGKIGDVTVFSEKGRNCTVQCPWEGGLTVTCEGENVPCVVTEDKGQMLYTFKTEAGKEYQIKEG